MPDQTTLYKIMLSAPGDTEDLCTEAEAVIQRWNDIHGDSRGMRLQRLHWGKNVCLTANQSPQDKIDSTIVNQADIFVVIFRHRLGTETKGIYTYFR